MAENECDFMIYVTKVRKVVMIITIRWWPENRAYRGQKKKKISVFRVTSLKMLGRLGTPVFFFYLFWKKYIILCISKGILPSNFAFQNA